MIQLDKQEDREPTEQEIQEYVNRVYDYAADLYINQNMSWNQVERELVKQGLTTSDASVVVENLQKEEHKAKHNSANSELGWGTLWLLGGIVLTALTAGNVLFYGAILWGGWLIIKGLYHKIS